MSNQQFTQTKMNKIFLVIGLGILSLFNALASVPVTSTVETDSTSMVHGNMQYKEGREALREYLRQSYWTEYERTKSLWQYRPRLWYVIAFDSDKNIKAVRFVNEERFAQSEDSSIVQVYDKYSALIRESLFSTNGHWIPTIEKDTCEYYYFDVF